MEEIIKAIDVVIAGLEEVKTMLLQLSAEETNIAPAETESEAMEATAIKLETEVPTEEEIAPVSTPVNATEEDRLKRLEEAFKILKDKGVM